MRVSFVWMWSCCYGTERAQRMAIYNKAPSADGRIDEPSTVLLLSLHSFNGLLDWRFSVALPSIRFSLRFRLLFGVWPQPQMVLSMSALASVITAFTKVAWLRYKQYWPNFFFFLLLFCFLWTTLLASSSSSTAVLLSLGVLRVGDERSSKMLR